MTTYWDTRTLSARGPRNVEQKLLDGAPLQRPPEGWTDAILAACGLLAIAQTPRPPDTATTTWDRTIDGTALAVVWTERAKTQAELSAEAAAAADETERTQARQAVGQLRAFALLPSPTAAQTRDAAQLMARVCARLIRDSFGDA